jgi:soluble lytic murein transglycosylase-like protein
LPGYDIELKQSPVHAVAPKETENPNLTYITVRDELPPEPSEMPLEAPVDASMVELSVDTSKTLIGVLAKASGVSPALALAIAECESNFEQFAKNPKSSAESYFQIIDGTWESATKEMGVEGSKFDPVLHIQVAMHLLKKNGTNDWLESKPCWSKKI